MSSKSKIKILVSPLDWGLGHATRCIPIIEELERSGFEVLIASSGGALTLLKKEFPHLSFFNLPSYNIKYSAGGFTLLKLLFQIPGAGRTISRERKRIQQIVNDEKIDIILSDNRFGVRSKDVYNIFMTHQTWIMLPESMKIFSVFPNFINKRIMNRYDEIWIPDVPEVENSLSGILSHKTKIRNTRYVGPITRFQSAISNKKIKYKYFAIISGPEPQRTLLEEKIITEFTRLKEQVIIAGGNPNGKMISNLPEWITYFPHMKTDEIEKYASASEVIISRSGYSTLMDLELLNKKAILIPTPGQTEQEYLAKYLSKRSNYYFTKQDDIDLNEVEKKLKSVNKKEIKVKNLLMIEAVQYLSDKFVLKNKTNNKN